MLWEGSKHSRILWNEHWQGHYKLCYIFSCYHWLFDSHLGFAQFNTFLVLVCCGTPSKINICIPKNLPTNFGAFIQCVSISPKLDQTDQTTSRGRTIYKSYETVTRKTGKQIKKIMIWYNKLPKQFQFNVTKSCLVHRGDIQIWVYTNDRQIQVYINNILVTDSYTQDAIRHISETESNTFHFCLVQVLFLIKNTSNYWIDGHICARQPPISWWLDFTNKTFVKNKIFT